MIDYAHNIAGLKGLAQLARSLCQGRLLGVIAAPGDRRSATIHQVGQVAGAGFDLLFLKEDRLRQVRAPGEVAAILRQGALTAGLPAEAIQVYLEERDALWAALLAAQPDDLIVVLYEDLDYTLSLVHELAQRKRKMRQTYVVAGVQPC